MSFPVNYFHFRQEEGFQRKHGWLINILPTSIKDPQSDTNLSAVNLFFMEANGDSWKIQIPFEPYFYAMCDFEAISRYRDNTKVRSIVPVQKIDLGIGDRVGQKISFANVEDLVSIRNELRKDKKLELREFDIPYYERYMIDNDVRVGRWYYVNNNDGQLSVELDEKTEAPPQPRILAFDIECVKEPLQFPNEEKDEIMMISYIVDGNGYLVTNRRWFSQDIESFEYSPLVEYQCHFTVLNFSTEKEMLTQWFEHIRSIRPHVMVTFNGDFFDWKFVQHRARVCGMSMEQEIGYKFHNDTQECLSLFAPHIDCFKWVQRDSYLPAGAQGLKAVTKAKLQYNPLELDPEDICPLGMEDPQRLANYSVSDAYATYYLYMKYVHPFIFSLTTVIPLNADECLRRGTGTLVETLLMARAFSANIFFPNKSGKMEEKSYKGHLLISESYTGGRVEGLESGIYRSDIPTDFKLDPNGYQVIIDRVPDILSWVIDTHLKINRNDITNYDEVNAEIIRGLEELKNNPIRKDIPIIIHMDVAAMYPNIILSNRLQPTAIVTDEICAKCSIRDPDGNCQRKMKWEWRGEFYPSTSAQNRAILHQLESEKFGEHDTWHTLSTEEQVRYYKKRLTEFCKQNYQKAKVTGGPEQRTSIICMKANNFYIETVRAFRDRRYEYKNKLKEWNNKRETAKTASEKEHVKKMIVLYESLQLAHKAILNSFYGYVMRTGARWRSIEMAGVVTLTGSTIIQQTRALVSGLGKPLELDTDGIWTAMPPSFPGDMTFILKNGQKRKFSFPCCMLNQNVDRGFSNHQYHSQNEVTGEWEVRKENSIFFEIDGPYHAMFLPAAKEEGKRLKKRYAVYNYNGHITELKGFEIKRRGEWKMIKMMQSDAFAAFMKGKSTEECYNCVADICRQYLNVLKTKGSTIEDDELLELMSESSTMSKSLEEYGGRKSPSATTARRLAELLGDDILNSKGLKCEFIISKLPMTESIAGRAIPIVLFRSDPEVILTYLKQWCQDQTLTTTDFREIIDWDYYTSRLHGAFQKILVIPAHKQGIKLRNFDVPPPEWMLKREHEAKMLRSQTLLNFLPRSQDTSIDESKALLKPKEIEVPKERDLSQLSDYQKNLVNIIKQWRMQRSTIVPKEIRELQYYPEYRIIELRESSRAGEITAFVQTSPKEISTIGIQVPRIFYINATEDAAQTLQSKLGEQFAKKVSVKLPHFFPSNVVLQVTLPEEKFQEIQSQIISSANMAGIHGIYETHVPPLFRALMVLGSSFNKPGRSGEKISHATLNNLKPSKKPKFPDFSNINKIFIYTCRQSSKGILAYVPIFANTTSTEAVIYLFYPSKSDHSTEDGENKRRKKSDHSNERVHTPPFKTLYDQYCQKNLEDYRSNKVSPITITKFNVFHVSSLREAGANLQAALLKFGRVHNTVVLLNSYLTNEQLLQNLKITALHQLPIIRLDFADSDNFFDEVRQVWTTTAAENFTSRFASFPIDEQNRMKMASDLFIPPSNLSTSDLCLNSLDLLFARELFHSGQVLWYSPSPEPDVGGAYENSLISLPGDSDQLIEQHKVGTYLSRCIEYRVEHLSTAAILQCEELLARNLPGHFIPSPEQFSSRPSLDAMVVTQQVFHVLSAFVSKLGESAETLGGGIYGTLLGHVGRWISSSSSAFFDPAIDSVYKFFVQKIFLELVNHFESSEIPVIFADQSRIIINPGAFDPEPTLIALKKKDLLRWINLDRPIVFSSIAFLDQFNFVAIPEYMTNINTNNIKMSNNNEYSQNEDYSESDHYSHYEEEGGYYGELNITRFMPKEYQEYLPLFLNELLRFDHDNMLDFWKDRTTELLDLAEQSKHQEPMVNNKYSMLRDPRDETKNDFLCLINAIFSITQNMGDEKLQRKILGIRANILKILKLNEFGNRTKFWNPSLSLIVPNVLCSSSTCLTVRNIDILRDSDILDDNWTCPICGQPYDQNIFKEWIIEELAKREESFVNQDLVCVKCRQPHSRLLMDHCDIDGNHLVESVQANDLRFFLYTVHIAAEFHHFSDLQAIADSYLEKFGSINY